MGVEKVSIHVARSVLCRVVVFAGVAEGQAVKLGTVWLGSAMGWLSVCGSWCGGSWCGGLRERGLLHRWFGGEFTLSVMSRARREALFSSEALFGLVG